MLKPIVGLHHVTAIASDPQQTLDFYTGVLGLRLVKRTVNFDDPGTYHLYFGDDAGLPGTILTFFPWSGMTRGTAGTGEVAATAFSIPVRSLPFWKDRLTANRLAFSSEIRFGEETIVFAGPDGMNLELVGHTDRLTARASRYANVPPEYAIHGFFGVTLLEQESAKTARHAEHPWLQKDRRKRPSPALRRSRGGPRGSH